MADTHKHVWTDASQLEPRLDAEFYQEHFLKAERRLKSGPVTRFHSLWRDSNRIYIGIAGFAERNEERAYTPYIRPTDVGPNGEIDWSRIAWCYAEWLDDYAGNGCAQPGDLLVEVKGNTRRVAVVDSAVPKNCIVSGSFWRLGLVESINPRFVLAFLLSDTGQLLKRRWVSNSVISWIDPHSFRQFLIPVPHGRVQDYIGAKVELAERCRAAARSLHARVSADLEKLYSGCPMDYRSAVSTEVSPRELAGDRIDAWYHQRHYIALSDWLLGNSAFVPLKKVARLSADRWSPTTAKSADFRYIEIADVDPSTGRVSHSVLAVSNAPSRAKRQVQRLDVLVSTVRPNRGAIGIVSDALDGAVATTGFGVVRPNNEDDAYFLLAVLRHRASTEQLMRCNTGSAYPAIEEESLLNVLIPGASASVRASVGRREMQRNLLLQRANGLVEEAKADVEALIDGRLDLDAIVSGQVKAPTAMDVAGLTEGQA